MADLGSTPPPNTTNDDKLSGKLIIKAQLGDDIRKMMIHNEDLTLNELVLMMERIFTGKISNSDELTIKYLDDDGDKITLLNDSDLTVALNFHKTLRLFLFVNGREVTNPNAKENANKESDLIDAKLFRNELQEIRNSVQTILDRLQLSTNNAVPTVPSPSSSSSTKVATTTAVTPVAPPPVVTPATTREFDPFKNLHQQQQRSATPDTTTTSSNSQINSEHQTAPSVDTQQTESSNSSHTQPSTQMPTPHFVPTNYNNEQQVRANLFGPPPTTYSPMPPLPSNATPQFPPPSATNPPPNFNTTSTAPPAQMNQPSVFMGQPPPTHQQTGGFYSQQQALFQQRPPATNFNPPNTYAPAQMPTNSSPATINPSYVHPPPPMASQQPYGAYPPQNSYYNSVQQYPKTS